MEQVFERGVLEKIWMIFGRDCRAMKRNCNCVTCRPFFSGRFKQLKRKVNLHAEDQIFLFSTWRF